MSNRKEFTMTEAQQKVLLEASKPVPYMIIGGVPPTSPQENANRAWESLGKEMGFKWDTVRPIAGQGNRHFTAECSEAEGGAG